jgi:hypothetical protein
VCIWTVPYPSIYLCMKEGCLFVFVVGILLWFRFIMEYRYREL